MHPQFNFSFEPGTLNPAINSHSLYFKTHFGRALAQKIFICHSGYKITHDLGTAVGLAVSFRHAAKKSAENDGCAIIGANITKVLIKKKSKELIEIRSVGFYLGI